MRSLTCVDRRLALVDREAVAVDVEPQIGNGVHVEVEAVLQILNVEF